MLIGANMLFQSEFSNLSQSVIYMNVCMYDISFDKCNFGDML